MLAVAITTVYRSAFARLERYFGVLATFGAYGCMHLARSAYTLFACASAWLAALGLVFEAFRLVEFLLFSGEREIGSTLDTS